jgi:hypothetical protein
VELSGWLLLVASWSVICGLAGYCMWRVLTDPDRGSGGA